MFLMLSIIYASPSLVFTFYMASTPPFIFVFMSVSTRGRQLESTPSPPTPKHTHMLSPSVQGSVPGHTLQHTPLYTYVLESPRGLNLGCLLTNNRGDH